MRDYEEIRQALIEESLSEATTEARYMAVTAKSTIANHRRGHGGASPEDVEAVRPHLIAVTDSATRLARASDLTAARAAFNDLTLALLLWRERISGPRPIVVHCAMLDKSWLQLGEPIENPYDPGMLRCGTVTSR